MSVRIGVDIGGTFTDFAAIFDATGQVAIHKTLTTPHDPAIAVLEGIATLLAREAIPMHDVSAIVHGSTLVTNAVIERRGPPTGMVVTDDLRTFSISPTSAVTTSMTCARNTPTRSSRAPCAPRSASACARTAA